MSSLRSRLLQFISPKLIQIVSPVFFPLTTFLRYLPWRKGDFNWYRRELVIWKAFVKVLLLGPVMECHTDFAGPRKNAPDIGGAAGKGGLQSQVGPLSKFCLWPAQTLGNIYVNLRQRIHLFHFYWLRKQINSAERSSNSMQFFANN